MDAFELNRRFGPRALRVDVNAFVVPIKPEWEERLFPEGRVQEQLFSEYYACGNGLRKAYLSRAPIRRLQRGDILLFYRSEDLQRVRFVTVVESTHVGRDPLEIARLVGTRTVYRVEDIAAMTENGSRDVLTILTRQARQLEPSWSLAELLRQGVLSAPPQTIQAVNQEGIAWVRAQLAA